MIGVKRHLVRQLLGYSQQVSDLAGVKTLVDFGYESEVESALPSTNTENGDETIDIGQVGFRADVRPSFYGGFPYRTLAKEGDDTVSDYNGVPYINTELLSRRTLISSMLGMERMSPERWNDESGGEDRSGIINKPRGTTTWLPTGYGYPYYDKEDSEHPAVGLDFGEVRNTGSNASVISYTSELNNSPYFESRFGSQWSKSAAPMTIGEIRSKLDGKISKNPSKIDIKSHAEPLKYSMSKAYDTIGVWDFEVVGGSETHTVSLKSLTKEDPEATRIILTKDSPVKVDCDCRFWKWNGPDYHAHAGGYGYSRGTPRSDKNRPTVRDPDGIYSICKHVEAVLRSLIEPGNVLVSRKGAGKLPPYTTEQIIAKREKEKREKEEEEKKSQEEEKKKKLQEEEEKKRLKEEEKKKKLEEDDDDFEIFAPKEWSHHRASASLTNTKNGMVRSVVGAYLRNQNRRIR